MFHASGKNQKRILFNIGLVLLVVLNSFPIVFGVTTDPGTPGDGYVTGDPCGFIMGVSTDRYMLSDQTVVGAYLNFDDFNDSYQGCVDENGYFYQDYAMAWSNQVGWVDFSWDSSIGGTRYQPNIDQTTGEWSGYAWNEAVGWIWFDWDCSVSCGSDTDRVVTDLSTGEVTGFAWNDQIGWLSFYGLSMEMAPYNVSATVQVFTTDLLGNEVGLSAVDASSAPFADGYQYYQIKVVLTDNTTGESLTSDDIAGLGIEINESSDTRVYLNQVLNQGNAIFESAGNEYLTECASLTTSDYSCEITDTYGETSFNYFIYSGAPTSNMLGIDENGDMNFDIYNDRDGGTRIYGPTTGTGSLSSTKSDYYYARDNDRNRFEIESIDIYLQMQNTDRGLTVGSSSLSGPFSCDNYGASGQVAGQSGSVFNDECVKYTHTYFNDGGVLSFKPRFIPSSFTTYYSGDERTTISENLTITGMYVYSRALIYELSREAMNANLGSNLALTVHYETDDDTTGDNDLRFLIDSDATEDGVVDAHIREDTAYGPIPYPDTTLDDVNYGTLTIPKDYIIGYAQETVNGTPSNTTVDNPTLEQWVCDGVINGENVIYQQTGNTSLESCYFTGYLPREDVHAESYDMEILGSINSAIDESDVFTDSGDVSVLGINNYISLRNNMYAQVVRLTRNQDPTATACGSLGTSMTPQTSGTCRTGAVRSLMSDTLLYAKTDVYVAGSTSCDDKTLVVVGANVYVEGNVTGCKVGIIAFKNDSDGDGDLDGGNVYIDYDVTDLYANIFIDGSVLSRNYWGTNLELRTETLWNQLHILGAIVARNTIGGVSSGTAPYNLGDGTTSNSYTTAVEYDLNKLREFRLCYQLDASGNILEDTDLYPLVDCDEGEARSSTLSVDSDAPLIIEYDSPSSGMPIFNLDL